MIRIAILVDQSTHKTTRIYVDQSNAKEILPYLHTEESIEKEFREIRGLLKENLRNKEKYKKVDVSQKANDMYEMRFVRNNRNDRIFCQEVKGEHKFRAIVMVELWVGKKSQEIPKQIKQRIETMGTYLYELQH